MTIGSQPLVNTTKLALRTGASKFGPAATTSGSLGLKSLRNPISGGSSAEQHHLSRNEGAGRPVGGVQSHKDSNTISSLGIPFKTTNKQRGF